jgi:hypothetical protein
MQILALMATILYSAQLLQQPVAAVVVLLTALDQLVAMVRTAAPAAVVVGILAQEQPELEQLIKVMAVVLQFCLPMLTAAVVVAQEALPLMRHHLAVVMAAQEFHHL